MNEIDTYIKLKFFPIEYSVEYLNRLPEPVFEKAVFNFISSFYVMPNSYPSKKWNKEKIIQRYLDLVLFGQRIRRHAEKSMIESLKEYHKNGQR